MKSNAEVRPGTGSVSLGQTQAEAAILLALAPGALSLGAFTADTISAINLFERFDWEKINKCGIFNQSCSFEAL